MSCWDDIDVDTLSESKAFRKGDFERACEPFSRARAVGNARRRIYPEDIMDDAIWCNFCKTSGKHLEADCQKKKAAAKAKAAASAPGAAGK